jgi:hypothetical protein
MTPWHVLTMVAMVCGAVVPGPCTFVPDPRWDCSLGDPCPSGFACAADGHCKSADVACADDETLCRYPTIDEVGLCVANDAMASSSAHCGACFEGCRGGAACVEGRCVDEPAPGTCVRARGHFDCPGGEACDDEGDGDDVGHCVARALGSGRVFDGCDDGSDCDGGLCHEGLCTRPCDVGCPAFSVCDEDAIPGGLCVPLSDDARCGGA